ncbi:MAG TPA: hypothetical protein VGU69_08755 [Rhizomicrobium sp.]|nr:hypothetical protein [Rhizomicrobium sp.]
MDLATALNIATTTAVVGGVIFGAWQIRVASRARETEISLQLIEMLQTRDLIEGLSVLQGAPEGLGWKQIQAQLGDRWSSAFALINALDGLGILVYRREVSPRVADDFFHHAVSEVWTKARSAILERRQMAGRETAFQFLEWLAESQTTFREQSLRRNAYPMRSTK